ncbi:DUF6350 family protein [Actinomyces sp. HMT897]|uniref:cell division protein PerM n=1 Tax=Actinomyces sp. HMT897 TaxID=2789424 RepID=UPI00190B2290|nr:DUF6350 family protein [Actinomyces sp. HMT897]QQO77635.1 beta-carotene 15,15'-monooxygenase [Actinomyces sp. HMT897]
MSALSSLGEAWRRGTWRPADWFLAARCGMEAVVLGWLLVVLPAVAFYLASSSRDAAAALSTGSVVRAATGLWSLALGGSWGTSTSREGALSLPLTGLTLLLLLLTRASVRRAHPSSPASGGWVVGAATTTALVLVLVASPAASRTWTVVPATWALTSLVVAVELQRSGSGWPALGPWWQDRPAWLHLALRQVRQLALVLTALAVVAAGVALVLAGGRVSRLHDALTDGRFADTLGITLLQLGWVPTGLVWALSWVVGPGFAVGSGSVFSPTRVVAGAVPSLPVLGALPTTAVGSWGTALPFVVLVAAVVVAWRDRSSLRQMRLRQAGAAAATASVVLGGGTALVCLAASGQAGPGRMAEVGPREGFTALIVGLLTLAGLGVVALITHPWGQVVTRRGAGATVDDTEDAAQEAREHVGTGAGDARRPGRPERGGSRGREARGAREGQGREAREGRRPEAGTPQWYPVGEDDVGPRDRGAAQGGTRRAGHPPARRGEDGLAP